MSKSNYLPPAIEIIEVETEGVIASSIKSIPNETWSSSSRGRNVNQRSSTSLNDLEDLINDILTYQ